MRKIVTVREERVALNRIAPNPWNPHDATPDEIDGIAASLKARSFVNPLVAVDWDVAIEFDGQTVEPNRDYFLIDGHQRLKAARHNLMSGDDDFQTAPVRVVGSMSDFQPWELFEVGWIANHQRGNLEDPQKSGRVVLELQRHRPIEQLARITGQRAEFLNRVANTVRAAQAGTRALPEGIAGHAGTRGVHTVVLPFETAQEVYDFEARLQQLIEEFADDAALPTTRGHKRTYALSRMIRDYFAADEAH